MTASSSPRRSITTAPRVCSQWSLCREKRSPIFDGAALAEELFRPYLEQILVSGFFHADPHPGNVFITADYRIALLDLGMVGRIMPRLQEDLLQLLLAISEGHGEEAANIAIKIGEKKDGFDSREFTRRISELLPNKRPQRSSKCRSAGLS